MVKSYGPKSYASLAQVPRGAGLRTRMAVRKNQMMGVSTMQQYRAGFKLMWRKARKYMKRIKIKEPGQYEKTNAHKGKMWALPRECSLTGLQAATVIDTCYRTKQCSKDQLRTIRKSLSYAHFLTTGESEENYPEVVNVWNTFDFKKAAKPSKSLLPQRVPTLIELKTAFTTPWSAENPMDYVRWSAGLLIAWDVYVCGFRPGVDMQKIKKSTDHNVNYGEGYQSTGLFEGKAKLSGQKRGTRPWRVYRVCLCRDGEHKRPGEDWILSIARTGNPTEATEHDTECPLAAVEVFQQLQPNPDEMQIYRRWLYKRGFFSKQSYGDVVALANEWFRCQGILSADEKFQGNAGRKGSAGWQKKLKVPYKESFQIHGDLEKVWTKHYTGKTRRGQRNAEREQSVDPEVCCVALRKFSKSCGRGIIKKRKLNRMEKLSLEVLKALGKGAEAEKILAEEEDGD